MSSTSLVRAAMIRLLGVGSMGLDELFAALEADPSLGTGWSWREQARRLLQFDMAFAQPSGGICYLPALAEGVAWTVRVDAEDIANGFVRMHPSLTAIGWWLVQDGADLIGDAGTSLRRVETEGMWIDGKDTDVVIGPTGWLTPGWMSFTVTNGALQVRAAVAAPSPTPRQVAAARTGYEASATTVDAVLFDGERKELRSASADRTIHQAMLHDREAFVADPVPYLPDLFAAAGLKVHHTTVAEVWFDWAALEARRDRNRMGFLYHLDERGIDALTMLVGACEVFAAEGIASLGETDEQRDGAAILLSALLEAGDVAEAFWNEYCSRGARYGEITRFVDEITERMGKVRLVGLPWMKSRCMDFAGNSRGAAELLESIVGPDCEHAPALLDAAAVAADRGDARTAARLVLQAGVEDDTEDDDPDEAQRLWREVAGFAGNRPKPVAQRNDRCPCGSGKKYKACHLGTERHSLDERASWLWDKAARYVRRHDPSLLLDLAQEMTEGAVDGAYRQLAGSPFTLDVALHEHEMFAEFLENRGPLLPEDEQLLAAQWALVDRGVFEVVELRDGWLRLRDIGRGETITVVNATMSPGSRPGVTMVGRPLPVGHTYRALGGFLPIPRHVVNPILDAIHAGNAAGLTAQIAATLQPTKISNTSGEELIFHTIRWDITDVADVDSALATAGFKGGDGSWTLTADTRGLRDASLAQLHIEAGTDVLTASVNSDERATLTCDRVASALPDARLVSDERKTLADVDDERDPDAPPLQALDETDPEVRSFMEEFIASKEVEWLDEQIPALGGRTPREAVQDPIGREEVRQLLDSFLEPPPGVVGGFSSARLRVLLGLDG